MIFNHSIISGYVVLQGSFVIHLPMLFVTIFFHDSVFWDQKTVMDEMFGADEPSCYYHVCPSEWFGGHVWRVYAFAIFMHLILGGLSAFKLCINEEKAKHFRRTYKSVQQAFVLFEVLNFCLLLQLYGYSQ